jgi:hypothetical protein
MLGWDPLAHDVYPYTLFQRTQCEIAIEDLVIYGDNLYGPLYNFLSETLRKAENNFREAVGAHKIGEGWTSETLLYYEVQSKFPNLEVHHGYRDSWLGRQHLDIFIPQLKTAIEFQGLQHDQPVEFFGGEDGYIGATQRDIIKRKKCKKNQVRLIEVRPGYSIEALVLVIEGKLSRSTGIEIV